MVIHRVWLLLAIVVLFVGGIAFLLLRNATEGETRARLEVQALTYCLTAAVRFHEDVAETDANRDCDAWVTYAVSNARAELLVCYQSDNEAGERFDRCLLERNLLPAGIVRRR